MKFTWSPAASSAAKRRKKQAQFARATLDIVDDGPEDEPTAQPRTDGAEQEALRSSRDAQQSGAARGSAPGSVVATPSGGAAGSVIGPRGGAPGSVNGPRGDAVGSVDGADGHSGDARRAETERTSRRLQDEGNQLAEAADLSGALAKWAAAIALTPGRASLHESRAQVLMEMGDTWQAVQAASKAAELDPTWAEGWITLSRAQLNLGEPEMALASASRALKLSPRNADALHELSTAQHLVAKQRQHERQRARDIARLAAGGVTAAPGSVHTRIPVLDARPSGAAVSCHDACTTSSRGSAAEKREDSGSDTGAQAGVGGECDVGGGVYKKGKEEENCRGGDASSHDENGAGSVDTQTDDTMKDDARGMEDPSGSVALDAMRNSADASFGGLAGSDAG